MIAAMRRWDRRLDESVDPRPLVPLRIAVGPLVVMHLQPYLAWAADGVIYRDRFTVPYAGWYPQLSRDLYVAVVWVTVLAAVMVSLGLFTRMAAWATAGGVAYNVFLSQTHFHHNRAFLLILLVGVAVLPTGRSLSLDNLLGVPARLSAGGGRRMALTVLRFEVAVVYLASGLSKLTDGDWFGGRVTRIRVERELGRLADRGLPDWVLDLVTDPGFHAVAARVIVLTELAIGLGLLWRRTRLGAVWLAIPFHLAIEVVSEVQVFSWAALAALVIWVTPADRDRLITVPSSRVAAWVRALDWTGRFRVEVGDTTTVVDRDGRVRRGRDAVWFTLTRLPLTFWPAAPFYALGTRSKEDE